MTKQAPMFEHATNYAGWMNRPAWGFMDSMTAEQIARTLQETKHTTETNQFYFIHTLIDATTPTYIYIPRR